MMMSEAAEMITESTNREAVLAFAKQLWEENRRLRRENAELRAAMNTQDEDVEIVRGYAFRLIGGGARS